MEPMQRKLASSQFDFGYTEIFCVPEVSSVFFSSCDSVLGDSLEFSQANPGSFRVLFGKQNCSTRSAGEADLIARRVVCLMDFLGLRKESVVYSPVKAGMSILNSSLFSEVRTPV